MKDRSREQHCMDDLCLCTHRWEQHFVNARNGQIWCGFDGGEYKEEWRGWNCPCKNFVLDNLKYIEDLAKEKGLV